MSQSHDYLNAHQIVEPGTSDKAAFDPQAYHKAMRGGRSDGMIHYVVAFLGGVILGFVLAFGFAPGPRFLIGLVVGLAFAAGLRKIRMSKLHRNAADAVALHAQAHELEIIANRLEVEQAKASGAFDQWDKP